MKIQKGFSLRSIAGSHIVVPVGTAGVSFKGMITLNSSGAFLWRELETDKTGEQLLQAMLEKYEIDESAAKADINQFVGTLQHAGLLE